MALSANTGITVPVFQVDETKHRRALGNWSLEVNQGRINNAGSVTLGSATVQTVVADMRVGVNSFVGMMPTTANAASAQAGLYITTAAGSFTIHHASSASTDRIFTYAVLGVG